MMVELVQLPEASKVRLLNRFKRTPDPEATQRKDGSKMATTKIAQTTGARLTHYRDNGQRTISVDWIDTKGAKGTTSGDFASTHMRELLRRAFREDVPILVDGIEFKEIQTILA